MRGLYYAMAFLVGAGIGSVLYGLRNMFVARSKKEEEVFQMNVCNHCGLEWSLSEKIPIIGYFLSQRKCIRCGTEKEWLKPVIEIINGLLYLWISLVCGIGFTGWILSILASILFVLSLVDLAVYEIPFCCNLFIGALGIVRIMTDIFRWYDYVIGFFAISLLLYAIYYFSNGQAIGGGDVKLMAAAGLVIGWKAIILAFFLGCIIGSVIHLIRMKVSNEEHILAMGPYLSMGILLMMLYGNQFLDWYYQSFL